MRTLSAFFSYVVLCILILDSPIVYAEQSGEPVYGRKDPAGYRIIKNVHKGAGSLYFQSLIDYDSGIFESNFLWAHRCRIPPKSGIGLNVKRFMEGIYWGFNIPAEFTINGHTALLPAGSSVLCPMGSSHGIYNNSDETLEWFNIAVSKEKGKGDATDYGEDLTSQRLESPAPFRWARFDRSLCKWVGPAHYGKGKILNTRPWLKGNFKTNWLRIGHCILPPGTSIGYHQHNVGEEVYYVMSGRGRMTVNDHTWDVGPGDAIPCTLHDSHGIYNNSDEDLDIFVLIVMMDKGAVTLEPGVHAIEEWEDDLSDR